jgi:hypothetical protein
MSYEERMGYAVGPEPDSARPGLTQTLLEELAAHEETLKRLEERLQPILRPGYPSEEVATKAVPDPVSDLHVTVRRLSGLRWRLGELTDRIDL